MFAKNGDEPGAGNTGAHRNSRRNGDGASISPNHPLAQSNPPRSAQENATIVARALLTAASKRDILVRVSPDQNELILVASLRVPRNVRRWFEHWIDQFRDEILDIIQHENGQSGAEQTREA